MKIHPDEMGAVNDLVTRTNRVKWALVILLSLPCLGIIKNFMSNETSMESDSSSNSGNNGDPFSIQATDQATDFFISGFGILSNAIAICAVYLSSRFCSEVYRTRLVDMLQARDAMRLEHLSLLHNSVNANDPVVAIFAASAKRDFSSHLSFLSLLLASVVGIYANIIPLAITRYSDSVGEAAGQRNIPMPVISDVAFGTNAPFDGNGRPTLGFLTLFYYSQLPVRNSVFGLALDNGTLPLVSFPFQSDETNDAKNIISLNSTALLALDISEWSYTIVPKTGSAPGLDIFDRWNTSSIEDGSSFSFDDADMYQCFLTKSAPWSSCPSGVPDSMPFTLVQKLPKLYGSYSFSSSVFYLPGSKIPDYPSTTPMGNQTAYVLKGKLTFRKSTVEGRRNYTTGQWRLVQSYYPDSSSQQQQQKGQPAKPRFRDFTAQEDLLYKKLKIAVSRLLANSFKSQSAFSDRPQFTWNQLRELINLDRLDASESGYSQSQFIRELVRRLVCVTGSWIMVMSSMGDPANSAPDSFLTVSFITGRIVKKSSFGIPILFAVFFLALWLVLVIAMVPASWHLQGKRRKRVAAAGKEGKVSLENAICEISDTPHGLTAAIDKTDDHAKKLFLQLEKGNRLVLKPVVTALEEDANPKSAPSLTK